MFEEEIELQTDTNNKGENLSVMSYKTDTFNTTRYSLRLVPLDDEKYSYRAVG